MIAGSPQISIVFPGSARASHAGLKAWPSLPRPLQRRLAETNFIHLPAPFTNPWRAARSRKLSE
ncbi:MAG: hypothetical protein DMF17_05270 [Verrucomicrobia bacterium]|nr:MAG: hypothetical protein DMF17_05270 [Verrucomicrobiota bacterium]